MGKNVNEFLLRFRGDFVDPTRKIGMLTGGKSHTVIRVQNRNMFMKDTKRNSGRIVEYDMIVDMIIIDDTIFRFIFKDTNDFLNPRKRISLGFKNDEIIIP